MESNKQAENRIDTSEHMSQSLFGIESKLETNYRKWSWKEMESERKKKQAVKNTYKERIQTWLRHEWIDKVTEIYIKKTDKEQKGHLHNAICCWNLNSLSALPLPLFHHGPSRGHFLTAERWPVPHISSLAVIALELTQQQCCYQHETSLFGLDWLFPEKSQANVQAKWEVTCSGLASSLHCNSETSLLSGLTNYGEQVLINPYPANVENRVSYY